MFECEKCGEGSPTKFASCPDGIPGCLVSHYDAASFLCRSCGHDNRAYCARLLMEGPHTMEIGMGVGNVQSIMKLELLGTTSRMSSKAADAIEEVMKVEDERILGKLLADSELLFRLSNVVHDSVVFEVPNPPSAEVIEEVGRILGLAEVRFGHNPECVPGDCICGREE